MTKADAIVVGSGPAGMLAAAALGRAGLRVVVLAPDPEAPWPNTYGAWVDDVADAELAAAMAATWDRVAVRPLYTDHVQRRYGCVDNAAWQDLLRQRCEAAGVRFVRGAAGGVEHLADRSVVLGDRALFGRIVIDATGAGGPFGERRGEPGLFQVAWGELLEADGLGDEMRWMDFGDEGSFLYAMPLGDRLFVEETELATRTVAFEPLRERLHRRLAAEGVRVRRTLAIERCRIPLDAPLPAPRRVVPFGAAAGMVQPSTGYLLARLVSDAPLLADAIAQRIERPPGQAVAAAWRAIWPARRLRQRALHAFGADVVARLDPDEIRHFFAAFFDLPADVQRGWLADTLTPLQLAGAMVRMHRGLPKRLLWTAGAGAVLASLVPSSLESP